MNRAIFKFLDGRRELYTLTVLDYDVYIIHDRPELPAASSLAELCASGTLDALIITERVFRRVELRYAPDWQGPLESPAVRVMRFGPAGELLVRCEYQFIEGAR